MERAERERRARQAEEERRAAEARRRAATRERQKAPPGFDPSATVQRPLDPVGRSADERPTGSDRRRRSRFWPALVVVLVVLLAISAGVYWVLTRSGHASEPTRTPIVSTRPAAGTPIDTWTCPTDGMVMVYVPAGELLMGSPEGEGYGHEHPQHVVYLDDYWIDRTEVTVERYRARMAVGACQESGYRDNDNYNAGRQPVVGVKGHLRRHAHG